MLPPIFASKPDSSARLPAPIVLWRATTNSYSLRQVDFSAWTLPCCGRRASVAWRLTPRTLSPPGGLARPCARSWRPVRSCSALRPRALAGTTRGRSLWTRASAPPLRRRSCAPPPHPRFCTRHFTCSIFHFVHDISCAPSFILSTAFHVPHLSFCPRHFMCPIFHFVHDISCAPSFILSTTFRVPHRLFCCTRHFMCPIFHFVHDISCAPSFILYTTFHVPPHSYHSGHVVCPFIFSLHAPLLHFFTTFPLHSSSSTLACCWR